MPTLARNTRYRGIFVVETPEILKCHLSGMLDVFPVPYLLLSLHVSLKVFMIPVAADHARRLRGL
eukprot:2803182-Pleurochrysis_carterae.AAC.1